jgi:hypothetical protein
MISCVGVDPASKPATVWVAMLAGAKSRGLADDHPHVVECRGALAFWRVRKAVAAEAGLLSRPGVDALVDQLRAAVAR